MTQNDQIFSILSFQLGDEVFGVNVTNVLEVLHNKGVTPIPRSETFVRGIVQFRGEIVTVIDFSEKLNLHNNSPTSGKVIVVFYVQSNAHSFKVGVLADDVKAVDQIPAAKIQPVEEMNHYFNPEFLKGVYQRNSEFVIVLDIDKIFSEKEIQLIKQSTTNEKK
ncbi:MAG: chemotaxis protein CheW [Salinivirgaceae bacterium]|jgi:purine-binding chemotaxis protein CheW|nr:chemotaxis protein CheW [Salinivirgaceae bacterium]